MLSHSRSRRGTKTGIFLWYVVTEPLLSGMIRDSPPLIVTVRTKSEPKSSAKNKHFIPLAEEKISKFYPTPQ